MRLAAEGLRRESQEPRLFAALAGGVGAITLGLATIGLFGVTAFVVQQRRHELTVRRPLGASEHSLVQLLLRDAMVPVAIGLACGIGAVVLGGRVFEVVLSGVSGRDPIAIGAAIVVLSCTAAAAVYVPSRRGARVDPAQLLKLS